MIKWLELTVFLFGAFIGSIIGFFYGWNLSIRNIGILIKKREGGRRSGGGREGCTNSA